MAAPTFILPLSAAASKANIRQNLETQSFHINTGATFYSLTSLYS
jgi:hypothetical protein